MTANSLKRNHFVVNVVKKKAGENACTMMHMERITVSAVKVGWGYLARSTKTGQWSRMGLYH